MRTSHTPDRNEDSTEREVADSSNEEDNSPCRGDPVGGLKKLFLGFQRSDSTNDRPVLRAAFDKQHGCVSGTFKVVEGLREELRVGVFSYKEFPAWVRFSSDTRPTKPDLRSTLGIGIKLFGVPGRKILKDDENALTHDFVLQNHDVFFVDNAREMCLLTSSGPSAVPGSRQILDAMKKEEPSVLHARYWSALPYALGHARYVKYLIKPLGQLAADTFDPGLVGNDYLREDLKWRMLHQGATLGLYLQVRTNESTMPLDEATVRWDETESEPILAATLEFPAGQNIEDRGTDEYGRNLSFNPWRVLPEHTPVGSISEARRIVYAASAEVRRNLNGIPIVEPNVPRTGTKQDRNS